MTGRAPAIGKERTGSSIEELGSPAISRSTPQRNRESRLISHARQLCALGVPSRALMPHLISTLDRLIGADIFAFHWASNDGYVQDVFVNDQELLYAAAAYHRTELSRESQKETWGIDFPTAMRTGRGWESTQRFGSEFERAPEIDLLWRPRRLRHGIEQTCTHNGRGRGSFVLIRDASSRPFSLRQSALLRDLSRHIGHAVAFDDVVACETVQSDVCGLVLADARYRLVDFSSRGRQLLDLSENLRAIAPNASALLPEDLRSLVDGLTKHDEAGRQPFLRRATPWGDFTFTAHRLGGEGFGSPVVAIHIEYMEPLRLQIARGALIAGLSRRQSELCVLLAEHATHSSIATKLSIRTSTVIDHLRKAYVKLNVHDHASLIARLRDVARFESAVNALGLKSHCEHASISRLSLSS